MKVIVGLGNPGHTYHETRHNVGFAVIQALADRHDVRLEDRLVNPTDGRPAGVAGQYENGAEVVRLLMPLTMMNESGDALVAAGVRPNELLVVCDDVSLPLGTIRLRAEGGTGGHHGLASCLAVLGTEQVHRLRVGVGTTPLPGDLQEFVLSRFTRAERPLVKQAITEAVEACEMWVRDGIDKAMNHYNRPRGA